MDAVHANNQFEWCWSAEDTWKATICGSALRIAGIRTLALAFTLLFAVSWNLNHFARKTVFFENLNCLPYLQGSVCAVWLCYYDHRLGFRTVGRPGRSETHPKNIWNTLELFAHFAALRTLSATRQQQTDCGCGSTTLLRDHPEHHVHSLSLFHRGVCERQRTLLNFDVFDAISSDFNPVNCRTLNHIYPSWRVWRHFCTGICCQWPWRISVVES